MHFTLGDEKHNYLYTFLDLAFVGIGIIPIITIL